MNMNCDECEKSMEFGKDGVCDCGKELCFDCYLTNGHREHMVIDDNRNSKNENQRGFV